MDRRTFIKGAVAGSITAGIAGTVSAASYYPQQVDQSLFESINRVKDPARKTPLEKTHAPVIKAPGTVKAGEMFTVEISVGEKLHVMTQPHWIEDISLSIANEPAGRADLQPKGYLSPRVQFNVVLQADVLPGGKVTLVATQHCNLHGCWESRHDIQVV